MRTVTVGNLQELPYAMEEAMNRLRVNIGFLGDDVRKIMVISTFPNEGKSLVTIELWRQMAQAGISSVFVDADMRKSILKDIHPLTSLDGQKIYGTSDFLSGKVGLENAIFHTQYDHGDLIFNMENVVNPSLMLESQRLTSLLKALANKYRYVFLDTPPLNLVSDGERIGSQCDGAVLVVRSGSTPTNAVKASMAQLERSGCPILGIVLNRAEGSRGGYYTKRYGGKYYGYGYGYGEYYYK